MTLHELHETIAGHCRQIAELLKPGFQVSVIICHPDNPGHELIVADSTLDQLAAVIERGRTRPALFLPEGS